MAESHREEITRLEALYAGNPGGRVFVHLAEAYRKAGEHDHARRILSEGLERHPDSASGFVVLGRVLTDLDHDDEAETAFRRVLELDGGNLIALRWLGDLARRSDRFADAVERYSELLARTPSDDGIRELLATAEAAVHAAARSDDAATEAQTEQPDTLAGGAGASPDASDAITPAVAAPGFTDTDEPADVEYGVVELDAMPADFAALAGIESDEDDLQAAEAFELELNAWTEADATDAEVPQDAGVAGAFEAEAETSQFEPIAGHGDDDDADPLDIHVLDATLAPDEDAVGPADEVATDLADLVDGGPEYTFVAGSEDSGQDALADALAFAEGIDRSADEDVAEPVEAEPVETESAGVEAATRDAAEIADEAPGDDAIGDDAPVEEAPADTAPVDYAIVEDAPVETESGDIVVAGSGAGVMSDDDVLDDFAVIDDDFPDVERGIATADDSVPFAAGATGSADLGSGLIGGLDAGGFGAALGGPPTQGQDVDDGLQTETIAELYSSQGFHERAADVYRSLLRQRPGDERLTARLRQSEAAMRPPAAVDHLFEQDAAGEVWLREAGTPAVGDPATLDTPYAWAGEPDDAVDSPPIRSWLQDLVGWQPATPAAGEHDAAAQAADDAGDDGEPEMLLDEEMPAAESFPAAGTQAAGVWTPDEAVSDPWAAPAEARPAPQAESERLPEPPAPWALAPQPVGPEPWAADPEPAQPEPARAETQPEPVTPEPDTAESAPYPFSAAPPATDAPAPWAAPTPRRSGDPVEDAFMEWFGDDSSGGSAGATTPPAPATSPGSLAGAAPGTEAPVPAPAAIFGEDAPASAPPPSPEPPSPEPPSPAAPGPAASDADTPVAGRPAIQLDEGPPAAEQEQDEDLEMFRSWLQGLKK